MVIRLLVVFLGLAGLAFGHQSRPKVIRVHVMTFGLNQGDYVEWMRGGDAAKYDGMMGLVEGDKAELLDVNVVVCRSGERVTLDSIREEIYPTEYEPPGFSPPQDDGDVVFPTGFATPAAYETRNTGIILEMESTLSEGGDVVDVRFSSEFIDPVGYSIWSEYRGLKWRKDTKMPIYFTHRVNTGLTLNAGDFGLAAVLSGKDKDGKVDAERKIVMFVMCEVMLVRGGDQ